MGEIVNDRQYLAGILSDERKKGNSVVFTNGCFDLIHPGHMKFLREASWSFLGASGGSVLVVAVNSDASVKRLKGNDRPIICLAGRQVVLSNLRMVDFVTSFDEDTPLELISFLRDYINVIVKGLEWKGHVVGDGLGIPVKLIVPDPNYSTTDIIAKIREINDSTNRERS
jgi:rfaE bifunctional protein nucleotidyltransferase chain/domain